MILKAIATHWAGRIAETRATYERILRRRANDPGALNFLGMLVFEQGDTSRGVACPTGSATIAFVRHSITSPTPSMTTFAIWATARRNWSPRQSSDTRARPVKRSNWTSWTRGLACAGSLLRDGGAGWSAWTCPAACWRRRAGRFYDELVVMELCEFMRSRPAAFDVVVSADTLVYFGGPYMHAATYVEAALAGAGLESGEMTPAILRSELGTDVHGFVVVARQPGGGVTPAGSAVALP
jgi:hypothetical protein